MASIHTALRPDSLRPWVLLETGRSNALLHSGSPKSCQVLGDTFGFIVQGLLFSICVGSLLLKWKLEKPQRRFLIFFLDSSKQIAGAGVIHILNMICAMIFSAHEEATADECAWYWVNIMIDTTFGVVVCYWILKASEKLFGYKSGHYGKGASTGIDWVSNPDYWKWFHQISVWCVIVCCMKLVVVAIMWMGHSFWEWAAMLATHWIEDKQRRLIFVMIVTPTCMNMFQFWVTDTFLKYTKPKDEQALDETTPITESNETPSIGKAS